MSGGLDMTKGKPWKLIIAFAIPVFLSNLFQQLYNSVDSLIVGNFLDKEALAAVSSSGNLLFLFNGFFMGTAMGAGVLTSRFFGSRDYENLQKTIHTKIAFGLCASLFLTVFGVIFSPMILKAMGTAPEVLPKSILYFRNYFIGVTGVIMYNMFSSTLQAVGDSRRPLIYLIISSVTNVILDLIFIAGFKWGVGAASAATAISQMLSAILCLAHLLKPGTVYQVHLKEIKFHKGIFSQILKYGLPAGIQNSVIALANVFVQSNINSFGGDAMAGSGSYSKIEGFGFLPINCFTMALTTYIGQNLGAKEYERAKKGANFGILTSMFLAEVIGVIIFIFAPQLIALFSKDENVIRFGVTHAKVVSLFFFLLAFSHCIAAIFRGAGKAIIPMFIMLIIWCGIRVLYITVMMHFRHEIWLLFTAYPLTWFLSSIIYFIYFKFSNWIYGFKNDKFTREEEV